MFLKEFLGTHLFSIKKQLLSDKIVLLIYAS